MILFLIVQLTQLASSITADKCHTFIKNTDFCSYEYHAADCCSLSASCCAEITQQANLCITNLGAFDLHKCVQNCFHSSQWHVCLSSFPRITWISFQEVMKIGQYTINIHLTDDCWHHPNHFPQTLKNIRVQHHSSCFYCHHLWCSYSQKNMQEKRQNSSFNQHVISTRSICIV